MDSHSGELGPSDRGFPGSTVAKNPLDNARDTKRPGFDPWARKTRWRREWLPSPVVLPGKFHGQRSLVGYSTWGQKQLDLTKHTHIRTCSDVKFCFTISNKCDTETDRKN